MTSRTASPLMLRSSSPGRIPAEPAGESGTTATMRADGTQGVYGLVTRVPGAGRGPGEARYPPSRARRAGPPRPAARLLRRCRDGDQGARVDGPGVRTTRVLLPRDRSQPA